MHHVYVLIISRDDRHVWTDRNSCTGMSTEIKIYYIFFMFLLQKSHKTRGIVKIAVINDNNNFAPSIIRSLCEFVGDCFGPRYFSSGAQIPRPKTITSEFHTMASK